MFVLIFLIPAFGFLWHRLLRRTLVLTVILLSKILNRFFFAALKKFFLLNAVFFTPCNAVVKYCCKKTHQQNTCVHTKIIFANL